jgi:ribosome-associated translation inhibitor RaiA
MVRAATTRNSRQFAASNVARSLLKRIAGELCAMRIDVLGDDTISRQARTYAEYRLFAALPYVIDISRIRSSRVVLRHVDQDERCSRVSCAVEIELDTGEVLRVTAAGDHPYAAINRMIDELKDDADARLELPSFDREQFVSE